VAAVLAVAALPHLVVEPRGVTGARVTVAPAAIAEPVTEPRVTERRSVTAARARDEMVGLDGTTRLSGAALTVVRDEMAKGPRAPVVMLLVPALVARTGRLLGVGLG
jgi:hypothetical protein